MNKESQNEDNSSYLPHLKGWQRSKERRRFKRYHTSEINQRKWFRNCMDNQGHLQKAAHHFWPSISCLCEVLWLPMEREHLNPAPELFISPAFSLPPTPVHCEVSRQHTAAAVPGDVPGERGQWGQLHACDAQHVQPPSPCAQEIRPQGQERRPPEGVSWWPEGRGGQGGRCMLHLKGKKAVGLRTCPRR